MKPQLIDRRILLMASAMIVVMGLGTANADQVKEQYHPTVNGSPITLMKSNMITQALGGRLVDLNVWVGEFFKFDDNIFNTRSNKKSDAVFSTAAGFLMQAEDRNIWNLRIEGQLQHNTYTDHSAYNGFEGYFHANGGVEFSPALSARVSLNYDNTYDNLRNVEDIFSMHSFSAGTGISLRPSPFFGVDVDYNYFGQRRDKSMLDYQDYDEHSLAVRPSYALTPNTSIYLQLNGSLIRPTTGYFNDASTFGAMAGLAWRYRDEADMFVEVGYKHMHFGTNGRIHSLPNADRDSSVNRPAFRFGGGVALTPDWKVGITGSYAPEVSATSSSIRNSNYIDAFRVGPYLQYSPGQGRVTARLSPYYSYNKPSNDTSYAEYGLQIGITYSFTDWFNMSAGYRFAVTDYKNEPAYNRNAITCGMAITF